MWFGLVLQADMSVCSTIPSLILIYLTKQTMTYDGMGWYVGKIMQQMSATEWSANLQGVC